MAPNGQRDPCQDNAESHYDTKTRARTLILIQFPAIAAEMIDHNVPTLFVILSGICFQAASNLRSAAIRVLAENLVIFV